jgi:hypothetical protein
VERIYSKGKTTYKIKNKALLRKTLQREFSKLFKDSLEHDKDMPFWPYYSIIYSISMNKISVTLARYPQLPKNQMKKHQILGPFL